MGIFLEVIECTDQQPGELARRIPRDGSAETKFGSQLVVRDYDGREYRYGDAGADPLTIRFTDKGAAFHIARDPRVGAAHDHVSRRRRVAVPASRGRRVARGADAGDARRHLVRRA